MNVEPAITEVRMQVLEPGQTKLMAYCPRVVFGGRLIVRGVKLVQTRDGAITAMPNERFLEDEAGHHLRADTHQRNARDALAGAARDALDDALKAARELHRHNVRAAWRALVQAVRTLETALAVDAKSTAFNQYYRDWAYPADNEFRAAVTETLLVARDKIKAAGITHGIVNFITGETRLPTWTTQSDSETPGWPDVIPA